MRIAKFICQALGRRRMVLPRISVLVAATLLAGCANLPGTSRWCFASAPQCASQALPGHAVHRLETWDTSIRSRPVVQRVAAAPPKLVEYLALENIAGGFGSAPRAAGSDEPFVRDVRRALEGIPPSVLAAVDERLLGIFLVEGLGSTGFTDIVDRNAGTPAAFVVLDAGVLSRLAANAWATWKENTPFTADPARRLQARIEADADDTRENAIQYILLHELAHVLATGRDIHPDWSVPPRAVKPGASYPFLEVSWRIDREANRYVSRWDPVFPERLKARYYIGARLDGSDLVPTYQNLARTDFPSLYAATHPADDFAESLASYVHVVLLQRPWSITISGPDGVTHTFGSCWAEPRCQHKRSTLEAILAAPK